MNVNFHVLHIEINNSEIECWQKKYFVELLDQQIGSKSIITVSNESKNKT